MMNSRQVSLAGGLIAGCRALAILVPMLLASACSEAPVPVSEEDIEANNRGVALMGYFDYPGARKTFIELVERRPDWLDARVNLAISTLNRQQEGDEQRALSILETVLEEDPDHLRAGYVSGLLYLYLGETGTSLKHLTRVAEADPGDAYAAYFIGQNLLQDGQLEETLEYFERAAVLDPYLRSAYYGAGLAARRLGRRDEARDWLAQYERLADNPRARLAEFKYSRMGPKAMAVAPQATPAMASLSPVIPAGPLFEPPDDSPLNPGGEYATLTTADVDGDGDQDVLLTGAATVLLRGDGLGGFDVASGHPLSGIGDVTAAAHGDVDNDGRPDVYLCRAGANQLWLQGAGGWQEAATTSGVADEGLCADAAMLDADHDGDLDLFIVNEDGPDELFNNNRDGTFRRLAADQGIAGGPGGRQFLAADVDADRDVDLIVINDGRPHDIWINDRLWAYRPGEGWDAFRAAPVAAALAADIDADGRSELHVLAPDGSLTIWSPDDGGVWQPAPAGEVEAGDGGWLTFADFDGDGVLERLVGSGGTIHLPDGGAIPEGASQLITPALPVLIDAARGPALLAVTVSGDGRVLRHWGAGAGRSDFLALTLSGKEDQAESMRSNRSGLGARVALRNLDRWTVLWTLGRHSAPGQSLQPLSIGLAGREAADYAAVDWSDGVFQTELDLASGELHRITETQRQLSSCPVLFAWDGERYVFVSDLLGVGGLGFFVAPGRYAEPRPWEYFLLPESAVAARDGRYVLKIAEPMEENAYLDALRLHVTDLPPGWDLVHDERMGTGAPAVSGRPITFRSERLPATATDGRGVNVLPEITEVDGRAAPAGRLDPRFIGRLAAPQELTLEFDEPLNPPGQRPVLVADGWVEYPYSQTVFAAWQAGASYDPPSLHARTADGRWHLVHAAFGYPAGMPRRMALPLAALPPDTLALRLSTNLEVYWDRVAVVYEEPVETARSLSLAPVTARLAKTGFPLRTNGPQRRPDYDYGSRVSFWDARYLEGAYTRLGPVLPLVEQADDAVVVMGSGEEVHVEFEAPPPPPPGWRRRIVLEARGWAKDMDLYTRDGGQVGPLPRSGPATRGAGKRRDELHAEYNLRFQGGR